MDSLVSTEWLAAHLRDADVVVVDASWHMPSTGRSGHQEYLERHIPGARFLDIDALSDKQHPAPHMLPQPQLFADAARQLGIGSRDLIVVYDNSPLRTAARGWFMLRHFGARRVAILDGGLQKWLAEGRPTESGDARHRDADFEPQVNRSEVVTKHDLLGGNHEAVLDARGKARFEGAEPDPRPGVAPGHIPGARNLPYAALYNPDGTFKSADDMRKLFADAGIDPAKPFIASCGSGVTANSLIFAAHLLGNHATRLYDGSWSEWGADPATPKALGPA
jgi:thiosulfate/3-mercaptopyruvate sulfurtransferase